MGAYRFRSGAAMPFVRGGNGHQGYSVSDDAVHRSESIEAIEHGRRQRHEQAIRLLLSANSVDADKLRSMAWRGIPMDCRTRAWRIFLDYEPLRLAGSADVLNHKRRDYQECATRLFATINVWSANQREMMHQIKLDLPRTSLEALRNPRVATLFERVLFVWGVRHPASGYVQGLNDILTPIFTVMSLGVDFETVEAAVMERIEADCFWCFSKMLDPVQDCFTQGQPGIARMLDRLRALIATHLPDLVQWFGEEGVELEHFAFRWLNCLLVRELAGESKLRVWDCLVAEHERLPATPVWFCAAMLKSLSAELLTLHASELLLKLQNVETERWDGAALEELIAEAFIFESTEPRPT